MRALLLTVFAGFAAGFVACCAIGSVSDFIALFVVWSLSSAPVFVVRFRLSAGCGTAVAIVVVVVFRCVWQALCFCHLRHPRHTRRCHRRPLLTVFVFRLSRPYLLGTARGERPKAALGETKTMVVIVTCPYAHRGARGRRARHRWARVQDCRWFCRGRIKV